jgi:hypothetical protein
MRLSALKFRKGSVLDIIVAVIVLFVIALSIIIASNLGTIINDEFQSSPDISSEGKAITNDAVSSFAGLFDKLYLLIYIGVFMSVIIGALLIDTHPVFLIFSIPLLAFILFIGAIFSNTFYDVVSSPELAAAASQFTIINFIMSNQLIFLTVFGLLVIIAIFAKGQVSNA